MASIEDKLRIARELKDQGNSHFKATNYHKAIKSYLKVFLYTRGLPGEFESHCLDLTIIICV